MIVLSSSTICLKTGTFNNHNPIFYYTILEYYIKFIKSIFLTTRNIFFLSIQYTIIFDIYTYILKVKTSKI